MPSYQVAPGFASRATQGVQVPICDLWSTHIRPIKRAGARLIPDIFKCARPTDAVLQWHLPKQIVRSDASAIVAFSEWFDLNY